MTKKKDITTQPKSLPLDSKFKELMSKFDAPLFGKAGEDKLNEIIERMESDEAPSSNPRKP